MAKLKQYELKVGEKTTIESGFFGELDLIYAGMPNQENFSIVMNQEESTLFTANSNSYNLYFPKSQKRIPLKRSFNCSTSYS